MLDKKTEQLTLVLFDERILSHICGFSETGSTHQIFTTTAVSLRTMRKMTSSKVVLTSPSLSITHWTGLPSVQSPYLGIVTPPGKKPFLLLLRRPTMKFNYIKASWSVSVLSTPPLPPHTRERQLYSPPPTIPNPTTKHPKHKKKKNSSTL